MAGSLVLMRTRAGRFVRAVSLAGLVVGCQSTPVPPTPAPSTATANVNQRTLDACDPSGDVPCIDSDAFVSVPIAGTGLALTYSSLWAPSRADRPDWDPGSLGLGGWSVSAVEGYAPRAGILVSGDGSWRFASLIAAGAQESAIPTYDASLAYVFDAAGRHVRTVDGRLGSTLLTVAYDDAGRLSSVRGSVDGRPVGLSVKRSSAGDLTALVGIDGGSTLVTLDPTGRLTSLRDAAGHLSAFDWKPGGELGAETDAMGAVTRFTYAPDGRLATSTDPDGVTTRFDRTSTDSTVQITATSALGRTSTYRTSSAAGGVSRTFVGPAGTTTTETPDAAGGRSILEPDGTTWTIGAAPSGVWGLDAPIQTPVVMTRSDGVLSRRQTSEDLHPTGGLPYAVSGTIATTVDGAAWTAMFDPTSGTAIVTDPAGRRTARTYDPAGRVRSATTPGRPAVAFTYDSDGRVASETDGTGNAARTTRFEYDADSGRLTVTRPDGSVVTESVDAAGWPVMLSAADGSTSIVAHDAAGHVTEVQPPGALGFTRGTSAGGRPTAFIPPSVGGDGAIETATYDGDGGLSAIAGPGPRTITLARDPAGRLSGWKSGQGEATLTYDGSSGARTGATDSSGVSTAYGHAGNLLASLAWSGPVTGSVATTLDGLGRTVAESIGSAPPIPLAYDDSGALTGVGEVALTRDPASGLVTREVLGPVGTSLSYDGANTLARSTTTVSGKVVLDRAYTRDALGRIATVTETTADGTTTSTAYAYDGGDRLSRVEVGGKPVETDTYDPAGDRTEVRTTTATSKATYDDRQRLTAWGDATYGWTPAGDLASLHAPGGATSFSFDDLGRLTGATLPSGRAITYLLDADGRRVGRQVDGRLVAGYLYDPAGHVVAETDATGALVARFGYDDAGNLALVMRGDSSYAVVTDALGSPRLVIDAATGRVADAIEYDAWGHLVGESSPGFIPFGFAGGLRDVDTGMVHFGARDYDPVTGRWISPDPISFAGGDANLYRYVGADPINATDPSGLVWGSGGSTGSGSGVQLTNTGDSGENVGPTQDSGDSGSNGSTGPANPSSPQWISSPFRPPGGSSGATDPASGTPSPPAGNPASKPPKAPGLDCLGICWRTGPEAERSCWFGDCQWGSNGDFECAALICGGPGAACVGWCYYGDTHWITADRVHADFQAAGEFLAATTPDGTLRIESRQEPVLGGTTITFDTAAAALVAGDRVGVYANEPSFLVVNGTPMAAADIVERLPHGGTVERHGGTVVVGWPDGSRLAVGRVANTLDLAFSPSAAVGPTLRGLLGSADGNPRNDLTTRDGKVLSPTDPAYATKLYREFGDSWRLAPSESLFDYGPRESTATFTKPDIPSSIVTAATLPTDQATSAKQVCQAVGVRAQPVLDDCVLDVAETGDPAFAASTAGVAAAGPSTGQTDVSSGPAPSQPPASTSTISLGQDVSGQITSPSQQDDHTLAASAGDIVYLHAEGTCIPGLRWVLLGSDGTLLGSGPGTCQEIGRVVLPIAGKYIVRVLSDGQATGAYRFVVTSVPPTQVDPITVGHAENGTIDSPGEWHDYTFDATVGQKLQVKGAAACSTGLAWRLLRPDGTLMDFHPACGVMGPEDITVPGRYTLRVLGDGAATGPFGFTLQPA